MIKGHTLHAKLDSLPCDLTHDEKLKLFDDTLDRVRFSVRNHGIKTLVVTVGYESGNDWSWVEYLDRFFADARSLDPSLRLLMIGNHWVEDLYGSQVSNIKDLDDVVYLDVYLLRTWYLLTQKHKANICQSWNADNKNILFLTGRPHKINRVRLLYKLLQTDLNQDLVYSFDMPARWEIKSRTFLPELSDDEWTALLKLQREPDNNLVNDNVGIPYGDDLYCSSLFQIISETHFDRCRAPVPHVTEKSWLSIINRRPFIMAGEFDMMRWFKHNGFYTFQELLPIPQCDDPDADDFLHYGPVSGKKGPLISQSQRRQWPDFYQAVKGPGWPDSMSLDDVPNAPETVRSEIASSYVPPIEDFLELRLDAIVENALYWQQNIKKQAPVVKQMVDHNHDLAMARGQQNFQRYNDFCTKHNIDFSIHML